MSVDLAAVLISAIAAGVSLYAACRARQASSRANAIQERLAEIEEARRLDERRPAVELDCVWLDGDVAVRFTNRGRIDLDEIEWEIIVDIAHHPLVALQDAALGQLGSLRVAEHRTLFATFEPNAPSGTARLRLQCRAGTEQWALAATVDLPTAV